MPLGPEPAGPIGSAQALRREVQLRCRDEQRLPGGQVGGEFGHGNPFVWRGEADTVELAMNFSQDVLARVKSMNVVAGLGDPAIVSTLAT